MSEKDDFDWHKSDGIVMKTSGGIAIYTNPHDDVVIRQDRAGNEFLDADPYIVIPRDRVNDVISALKREIEE